MKGSKYEADGVPDERGFFQGLAQAPLYFHQAVAELVDNSIAEKKKDFDVVVDVSELQVPGIFQFSVLDNGPGVSLDLLKTRVFKTGYRPPPGSSHLREHGFGLKNVLAKVESLRSDWEFWTRDADAQSSGIYYLVKSPLRYKNPIEDSIFPVVSPETSLSGVGTLVKATIPLTYLQTVSFGRRGAPPTTIGKLVGYLREHLGVYYRSYLEGGRKSIGRIRISLNGQAPEDIEPIFPDYATKVDVNKGRPFSVTTTLGRVKVSGWYGRLNRESVDTKKNRLYYYRNTPESQGIDFRIGHRVVSTRLVTEIWGVPRHPTLNAFCGEFRVHLTKMSPKPSTLNNKTSLSFDDPIWIEIAGEIAKRVPTDELPRSKYTLGEKELRNELVKQLQSHFPSQDIETDYDCYSGVGVLADIVRFVRKKSPRKAVVYEVKSGKAVPLDVYQLIMYWDGLVDEGIIPTQGLLVAKNWSPGTKRILNSVNSLSDMSGNNYKLSLKSWKDFRIGTYP